MPKKDSSLKPHFASPFVNVELRLLPCSHSPKVPSTPASVKDLQTSLRVGSALAKDEEYQGSPDLWRLALQDSQLPVICRALLLLIDRALLVTAYLLA